MLPEQFPKPRPSIHSDQLEGIEESNTVTSSGDLAVSLTTHRENNLSSEVHFIEAEPLTATSAYSKKSRLSAGVWTKYQEFWESDQGGLGIVAHDNTINHNIVVIKKLKIHAGSRQYRLLHKVSEEKPSNIVHLIDIFADGPLIHLAYESLETSLHQIQATCHQDITEIELAIIGKEVGEHTVGVIQFTYLTILGTSWNSVYP